MVSDDNQDVGSTASFFGLGGESHFRAEVTSITQAADVTSQWLEALQPVLRRLVNYDAAWLGRFDGDSGRYQPLLEDGDVEPLRELFASDVAAADIRQLGFLQPGWPLLGHRILKELTELQGWSQYLAPAGFRDGIGVGLRTDDGRHVGYLTLLTYRSEVVPATAAALLHNVNPLIADAVDRTHPHPESAVPDAGRKGL